MKINEELKNKIMENREKLEEFKKCVKWLQQKKEVQNETNIKY